METSPDVCVIFKCTGVFPAKRQGCTVCNFNLVLPFAKKGKKKKKKKEQLIWNEVRGLRHYYISADSCPQTGLKIRELSCAHEIWDDQYCDVPQMG